MRYAIIILIVLAVPALAHSATLKVPSQYPSIQAAIDVAVNGDTVLVAPGTYVENIDFMGKSITVKSEQGPDVTTIDGNQAGRCRFKMCGFHRVSSLCWVACVSIYCESLPEISTIRGEIPSRKGYPGYLYSDLSELYERSGMIEGSTGSITQLPILTMPNDDISHPIPDLTGYITEGQIVFDREMHNRGIQPPIAGLPSLSRLMKDGIGENRTRKDHPHLASQLFAAYSYVKDVRNLASVIGEEELTPLDQQYLAFGEFFEKKFISQASDEDRTIEETLDIGWRALSMLPVEELHRVTEQEIENHYVRP